METYRDRYNEIFRNGRDIALIAINVDTPQAQFEWARDSEFPFPFASDSGAVVGRRYGAFRRSGDRFIDNRTVFIIDEEGIIRWRAAPFREIDPMAYEELKDALDEIAPPPPDPDEM